MHREAWPRHRWTRLRQWDGASGGLLGASLHSSLRPRGGAMRSRDPRRRRIRISDHPAGHDAARPIHGDPVGVPFVDDPDLLARVRRCSWEVMRSIHDPRGGRSGRGDVLLGPVPGNRPRRQAHRTRRATGRPREPEVSVPCSNLLCRHSMEGMMRFSAEQDIHDGSAEADESFVRKEIERIRGFVGNLSMGDPRQGTWFVKLLAFSLDGYVQEVDAAYFREKYPDLPADAVVDARVRMAANYAGIEGGLSAAAYNGAVAATIGSGGAASPLTLPTGGGRLRGGHVVHDVSSTAHGP